MTKRDKALAWWKNLSDHTKSLMADTWYDRMIGDISGREIEEMWTKLKVEPAQENLFKDEAISFALFLENVSITHPGQNKKVQEWYEEFKTIFATNE